MPKFITVTPNPAIDRTYLLPHFAPNEVNRAEQVLVSAGGKGINVARALKTLSSNVVSTGFVGGAVGEQFKVLLNAERIKHDFLDVSPEQTRLAIVVADRTSGKQTVVNEPGPSLSNKYVDQLEAKIIALGTGTDGVVFSGSLPVGITPKRYRSLIESVKAHTKLTLLDSTGDLLNMCVEAMPSILKINRSEALSLGINIKEWHSGSVQAAEYIRDTFGIEYVAITDGSRGAVLVSQHGKATAQMPKMTAVSAVGSGDSFAAGLIHALASIPDDIAGALRLAAACGGANAMTDSPGVFTSDQIVALSGRIKLG